MANKTFVPGIDPYSRNPVAGGNPAKPHGGTIVPGMHTSAADAVVNERTDKRREDPVVGFLYSISRQGIGEFWPVYVGKNTIGSSDDCDVCLREQTVSGLHAVLNARVMDSTHKVIASIQDKGSKNGIFVGSEELDYDMHPVKHEDVLRIGKNYKLLLLLIDTQHYGLHVAENFLDKGPAEEEEVVAIPGGGPMPGQPDNARGTQVIGQAESQFQSGHTRMGTV